MTFPKAQKPNKGETGKAEPHACVHCEGGGCYSCQHTGFCVPSDLFEDLSRRIKNVASKMDIILFNVPMKNKSAHKDLIEDVITLQCFYLAAYNQPSEILEKFLLSLSSGKCEEKKKERNDTGSYFTPPYIAEYIVEGVVGPGIEKIKKDKRVKNKIKKILTYRICDPCVGGGIFLVCAHDYLMTEILKLDPKANLEEVSGQVARKCLFGVDINPEAVEGCKLALHLNIAKWRLKKQIEEFASSAELNSSSPSANSDNPEKHSSVPEPARESTNTPKTTKTKGKKRNVKRAKQNSQSQIGTGLNDSAHQNAQLEADSENPKTTRRVKEKRLSE